MDLSYGTGETEVLRAPSRWRWLGAVTKTLGIHESNEGSEYGNVQDGYWDEQEDGSLIKYQCFNFKTIYALHDMYFLLFLYWLALNTHQGARKPWFQTRKPFVDTIHDRLAVSCSLDCNGPVGCVGDQLICIFTRTFHILPLLSRHPASFRSLTVPGASTLYFDRFDGAGAVALGLSAALCVRTLDGSGRQTNCLLANPWQCKVAQ